LKVKDEKANSFSMRQIADLLPDLKVYHRIYPDHELQLMICQAYKDIILFAREAIFYFLGSEWARQLRSMGKPLQFQSMQQGMMENLTRIRVKCEVLLAARVDDLINKLQGERVISPIYCKVELAQN
jgi:hypothetical protein